MNMQIERLPSGRAFLRIDDADGTTYRVPLLKSTGYDANEDAEAADSNSDA